MFENWKNLEGTYVNPIMIEDRMTTIDFVRQSARDKNPDTDKEILEGVLVRLELVPVKYLSYNGKVYKGQVVMDKDLVKDIQELFEYIEDMNNHASNDSERFFIETIIPITNKQFDGDDNKSMEENNTSGHNYRPKEGTKILSTHAFAFPIDMNPRENPMKKDGRIYPQNAEYDEEKPNTLTRKNLNTPGSKIISFLIQKGFEWGGDWKSLKDYQHFQKVLPTREFVRYYKNYELKTGNVSKEDIENRLTRLIQNSHSMEDYAEGLKNIEWLIKGNEDIIAKIGMKKYVDFLNLTTEKIHNEQIRP